MSGMSESSNANREPPTQVTYEADQNRLEMTEAKGTAYQKALDYMVSKVADAGGKQRAGDYTVGFIQERAEGMYMFKGKGQLE
jgi:hypothetical protein